MAGATLGERYQLIAPIAAGGMAQVWSARDLDLNRDVAVKLLHPHLLTDDGFVTRFRREAVAAARLSHRSIVSVYDTLSGPRLEAIVMELVDGRTLREALDEEGALPVRRVLDIGQEIAEALSAAHAAGLVHRDIKPANIMIRSDGRVLVTDFGIAKAADDADLTTTGTLLGTAKYLSPEQVTGEPVDPRSDLYSLGVVLFEALAGTVPFRANTDAATALARIREAPPSVRRYRANVPPAVEQVILRLMARDITHRYASAQDVAQALGAIDPTAPAAPGDTGADGGLAVDTHSNGILPPGVAEGLRPPDPPRTPVPYPGLMTDPGPGPGSVPGSGGVVPTAGAGTLPLDGGAAQGQPGPPPQQQPGPRPHAQPPAPTGSLPRPAVSGPAGDGAGRAGSGVTAPPDRTGTGWLQPPSAPPGTPAPPHWPAGDPGPGPGPEQAPVGANGPAGADPSVELIGALAGPDGGGDERGATTHDSIRQSRWLPIVVLAAVAIGLAVVGWLVVRAGGETARNPFVEDGPGLTIVDARSFDPQSLDEVKQEREELVPLAFDGDPETAWTTEPYRRRELSGLKDGVGLLLTLEESLPLNQVEMDARAEGWRAEIYVGDEFGTDPEQWGPPAAVVAAGSNRQVRELGRAEGSMVLLWINDTGVSDAGRFQFVLNEIVIR